MKTALRASRRSTVSQRLKRGFTDNVPRNFSYTGAAQTTVVPAGALSAVVDIYGAEGVGTSVTGGKGGRLQATIPVTPGEVLQINVGEKGSTFGGGGPGGSSGAAGGGATDIRRGAFSLANRIVVAGGGGGAGKNEGSGPNPGHGGGTTAADGGNASVNGAIRGGGGTPSAGGTGGAAGSSGTAGTAGTLGVGGTGGSYGSTGSGGGGGGGYYGGGGGGGGASNGAGGGGGSSYADPAAISVVHTQGARTGHGSATITFSSVPVFDLITFAYTGAAQTTVVPVGAVSAVIDLQGAAGGAASNPARRLGGRLQARIPVTPGETLQINVGGQGSQVQGASASGGWNGGGGTTAGSWGMSGGGATDIRRGAFGLADRIAVAGGAGGAGYTAPAVPAGAGGGLTGQNGAQAGGGTPGQGGTQSAGGAAGTGGDGQATAGALGIGGLAGRGDYGIPGAGGGGYYGGGGATATMVNAGGSDGGGGSSYTVPESVEVVHTQGYRLGNGVATVIFSAIPAVHSDLLDEFTRADSTTSAGSISGKDYTNRRGTVGISGNRSYAALLGSDDLSFATIDSGFSDGDVEIEISGQPTGGKGVGVAYRVTDLNNFRFVFVYFLSGLNDHSIYSGKVEGGILSYDHLSNVSLGTGGASIVGKRLRVEFDGNQISVYWNASKIGSTHTSAFGQTLTNHGPLFQGGSNDSSITAIRYHDKRVPQSSSYVNNFDNLDGWEQVNGAWDIESGNAGSTTSVTSQQTQGAALFREIGRQSKGTLELTLSQAVPYGGGSQAGVIFRAKDANNWCMALLYNNGSTKKLYLGHSLAGVITWVVSGLDIGDPGVPTKLTVDLDGPSVVCKINNVQVGTMNTSIHIDGTKIGASVYSSTVNYIDRIEWTPKWWDQELDFRLGAGQLPAANGWTHYGTGAAPTFHDAVEGLKVDDDTAVAATWLAYPNISPGWGATPTDRTLIETTMRVATTLGSYYNAHILSGDSAKYVVAEFNTTGWKLSGTTAPTGALDMTVPRKIEISKDTDTTWSLWIDNVQVASVTGIAGAENYVYFGSGAGVPRGLSYWKNFKLVKGRSRSSVVANIPSAGLVRKFIAGEQMFQDTAKTIAAVADNDVVRAWGDQVGVSDLVKAAGTTPRLKTGVLNGKKALRFAGDTFMDTAGPLFNANGSAATMVVVSDAIGAGAGSLLSTRAASPGTGGWLLRYNNPTQMFYAHIGQTAPPAYAVTDAFHTHVVRRSGGNAEVGSDGVLSVPSATTYSTSAPGGTRVGADFDVSDLFNGDIVAIFIWDRALSNFELDQVLLWINEQYALAWT